VSSTPRSDDPPVRPLERPLGGIRILDLSQSVAGAFCARLLADLGADVVSAEPAGERLHPGDSDGWGAYLRAGKHSITLPEAAGSLARLAAAADAVVVSPLGPPLDPPARPDLVTVAVSPYGLTGPYRDWQATEIVEWALGGYMYFGGTSDREPLLLPGHQAQLHGGMQAAVALLAGLQHARRSGAGQAIEVSDWEATLSAHWRLSIMWSHTGEVWKRLPPDSIDFLPCLDGEVFIMRTGRYDAAFFAMIGQPELAGDPRWATPQAAYANSGALWAELRTWTARNTVADVVTRAQAHRVAASAVNTLPQLLGSEQLQGRQMVVDLKDSDGNLLRLPAAPYKLTAAKLGPYAAPPARGADTAAAVSGTLWPAAARPPAVTAAAEPAAARPAAKQAAMALDGLRVLELGANWAGPMLTRSLADLGAEVVKVEGARRPATRVSHYPGNEPGKRSYNRSGYFNKMNRNKLGLSLDITTEAGREVFLELAQWADVFVENQSPQVLRKLRITYDDMRAVNPRLIMVCITGFGLTGPAALHAAYGTNIEASGGLASLLGYEPGERLRTGSLYADPLAGSLGAIAVLAALRQREVTGQGQLIDLALQETMLAFFGSAVTDVLAGRPSPGPRGNRDAAWAPQGCYPCFGDDMWLVLSVRTDAEWAALCSVTGRPDLAARADLRGAAGRRRAHDEIDTAISGWSTGQDHREAAEQLQAAGVPAAPVLKNWELLADPHLHERGFYRPIPHPDTGAMTYPGFPWQFAGTPARVRRPAPRFAEHNDVVLRQILGLAPDRVDALARDGIIDTVPYQPDNRR
jgi:crotonobetainyl-CoA:carnitine CoA-transferase CaiB-like acyl-CoA transferase